MNHNRESLLGELLKGVSRSFYLTLRILPTGLREPIGIAYLLARAADTIADTRLISPKRRLEFLLSLRGQVNDSPDESSLRDMQAQLASQQIDSNERTLLLALGPLLALLVELGENDRKAVCEVVTSLTTGMEFDLKTFPDERSGQVVALPTTADLDRYTYLVAGCVGEFWTKMSCMHTPALRDWNVQEMSEHGIRFGKALQMVNVLRDCAKDLRIGRCYLPLEKLAPAGLRPEDLLKPENSLRARPAILDLLRLSLEHFRAAEKYLLSIPRHCQRLRLACLWPVLIGLETLSTHARNNAWLDPALPSKITRRDVYRIVALSTPVAQSNTVVKMWIDRQIAAVHAELQG